MKKKLFLVVTIVLLTAGLAACAPEEEVFDDDDPYVQTSAVRDDEYVAVMTTNYGVIHIRFFPRQAPLAVESFLGHSRAGFYDGLTFHRVWQNFMIQGGCPEGTGGGGTTYFGHGIAVEHRPNLTHIRGAVSMANADNPAMGRTETTGSQFFIVDNPAGAHHLEGRHTVFGQVIEGMDVVDAIAAVDVVSLTPGQHPTSPVSPVIIESIEIVLYGELN